MTREHYQKITEQTRQILRRLPFGESLLRLPTFLIACIYAGFALTLLTDRRPELWLFLVSPAVCFLTVTILRTCINRTRPYDLYQLPPVGRHMPGKGKSMPSRHAASAVAILMAVLFLHPPLPFAFFLIFLAAFICFLRVAAGQHYPSDVIAGALLSIMLSLLFYWLSGF